MNPVLILGAFGTGILFVAFMIWSVGAGNVLKKKPISPNVLKVGWYIAVPGAVIVGIALVILWVQTVFFHVA